MPNEQRRHAWLGAMLALFFAAGISVTADRHQARVRANGALPPSRPVGWVGGSEIAALTLWRDSERDLVFESQRRAHFNTIFVTVKQFDGRLWYYTEKYKHPI